MTALRERFPEVAIMMGVGNLTELTEADTSGINAVLLGIAAELASAAVLTTQVSPHARRAVREADWARRIMHAAREAQVLPKGMSRRSDDGACEAAVSLQRRRRSTSSPARVRDPNFRVQVVGEGMHVYNRDGHRPAGDPFELCPQLKLESDGGHAFYMGVELARAEIAWQLGKRYVQDQPLDWGCAVDRIEEDLMAWRAPGATKKKG